MPVLTERRAACVAAAQRVRRARRVRRASSVVRVLGAGGVEQRAELEVRVPLSAWAVTARHGLVSRVPGRSKGCFPVVGHARRGLGSRDLLTKRVPGHDGCVCRRQPRRDVAAVADWLASMPRRRRKDERTKNVAPRGGLPAPIRRVEDVEYSVCHYNISRM